MELIMVFFALFIFFFGSVLSMKAMEVSFKLSFQLMSFIGNTLGQVFLYMLRALKGYTIERLKLRPIFEVTPLELQRMRNNKLYQSRENYSVLIENPPQKTFG